MAILGFDVVAGFGSIVFIMMLFAVVKVDFHKIAVPDGAMSKSWNALSFSAVIIKPAIVQTISIPAFHGKQMLSLSCS